MQLLKNDDGILPLKDGQKVAVIGEMAKAPRFQGAGSSVINPTKLSNAFDELQKLGVDISYAQGYYKSAPSKKDKTPRKTGAELIAEAKEAASKADVAVVFVGLTEEFEGEGYDREGIEIPAEHNELVAAVAEANPNTVVVIAGGSVILMPWLKMLRDFSIPVSAVRQAASPLQTSLPARSIPPVRRVRLIRAHLRITRPTATSPADPLPRSTENRFTSVTDIMTQPILMLNSRLVSDFHTPPLSTAILSSQRTK